MQGPSSGKASPERRRGSTSSWHYLGQHGLEVGALLEPDRMIDRMTGPDRVDGLHVVLGDFAGDERMKLVGRDSTGT